MKEQIIDSKILLRVAANLQKEYIRQTDEDVKSEILLEIEGLKSLYKEVEAFRTIKNLLK